MAPWNTVMSSAVALENRIDGEYYSPAYLDMDTTLSRIANVDILGRLVFSIRKGIFDISPNRYRDKGVPLVRTLQIKSPLLSKESLVFIDAEDHAENFSKTELLPGDIVFTKIGAGIGDVAVLPSDFERYNFSQNVAGASVYREKIDGFYLLAYLATKWGRKQLLRYMMPSGQGKLELRDIKKIRIVRLGNVEAKIGNLIVEAQNSVRVSHEKYALAKQFLESELGLDTMTFQKSVGYTARFSTVGLSDAFSAGRIDAQCFAPDALFYEHWLPSRVQCDRLGSLLRGSAKGRQQADLVNGSTDYCSIKHISGRELVDASKCSPAADTPLAGLHDLLLAITGATIGKIGIVKRYNELAFSGDLLCLRTTDTVDPHYLLLALDHQLGQVQFNRWITGSTNGHLAPRDVARVLVPRLSRETEAKIAEWVKSSLTTRRESEQLIEQAKASVEQFIEEAVQP